MACNSKIFLAALTFLLLPVFIFLFAFFSYLFVATTAVALAVLVWCMWQDRPVAAGVAMCITKHDLVKLYPILIACVVIITPLYLSPPDLSDLQKNYAILNLMRDGNWPSTFEFGGEQHYLRYYLSDFVGPALLAKAGMPTNIAFCVYTLVAALLMLVILCQNLANARQVWLAIVIFFSFAGLDQIGLWLNDWQFFNLLPEHEWWSRWAMICMNMYFVIFGPTFFVAVYLGTIMALKYPRLSLRYAAVVATALLTYSPFAIAGFLSVCLWLIAKHGIRHALSIANLVCAPLLAMPIVLYVTSGTEEIPIIFAWQHELFALVDYILFLMLEIFIITVLLVALDRTRIKTALYFCIALLGLSVIHIGTHGNAFLFRAAAPIVLVWTVWMIQSFLAGRRNHKIAIATYLMVAAIPVYASYITVIRPSYPRLNRQITFANTRHVHPNFKNGIEQGFYFVPKAAMPSYLLRD